MAGELTDDQMVEIMTAVKGVKRVETKLDILDCKVDGLSQKSIKMITEIGSNTGNGIKGRLTKVEKKIEGKSAVTKSWIAWIVMILLFAFTAYDRIERSIIEKTKQAPVTAAITPGPTP